MPAKMKIVIIGAGIAGLSTYLLLKKHVQRLDATNNIEIVIYEAYDVHKLTTASKPISEADADEPAFTPVALGNALGVSLNGIKVISRLDKTGAILSDLRRRGNPVTRWRMSTARGWDLVNVSTGGHTNNVESREDSDPAEQEPGVIMIARQDLWEVMRDAAIKDGVVILTKKVNKISIGDQATKNLVHLDDGSSEEADPIVGADGLRSCVRRAMFEVPQPETTDSRQDKSGISGWIRSWFVKDPSSKVDYITPHYEGLGGLGGFIPTEHLQSDNKFGPETMNIVFGNNGFFGYGCISSPPPNKDTTDPSSVSAWWSAFSSPVPYPYRRDLPNRDTLAPTSTSTPTSKAPSTFDSSTALQDLQSRHHHWQNPSIQTILTHASQTGLSPTSYYPTWTTPELPHWSLNGRAVLVGDAAHALQPSSGQGASQALEDAEALALLLAHYLAEQRPLRHHEAVTKALDRFEKLRRPRVHAIYERSQKMSKMKADMGIVMEMFVYFVIWAVSFFHDKQMDAIVNCDLPREVERIVAVG